MSKLSEELKRLQILEEKVNCLKYLGDHIESLKLEKYPEVADQTKILVLNFVNAQVEKIESGEGEEVTEVSNNTNFNQDEIDALKMLVNKLNKPVTKLQTTQKTEIPKPNKDDVLTFARKHQHLDGKEVTVITDNGNVKAEVIGLSYPNVVVQTITGYRVNIAPEKLIFKD